MIICLSDIVDREFVTLDAYDGLCKAERMMEQNRLDFFPVMKEEKLVGVLTARDMSKSHPNRIVADAMTKSIIAASSETSLWEAKALLEKNLIKYLLVVDYGRLIGVVSDTRLFSELGKHTDILTGLYKSDYIYYHGIKLLEKESEISVIFIDVDKFGQIDKEYGHINGDSVLKELGKLINIHTDSDSHICRFGGDEFVILTPYKLGKCKILAESLLKAISAHNYPNGIAVAASAGIAGGRRQEARSYNLKEIVSDLINLASLASTKAKMEKDKLAVAEGFCDMEIA